GTPGRRAADADLDGPGRRSAARGCSGRLGVKGVQERDRLVNDRLARAAFEEAVQAGPDLVAAPVERAAVGDVADVVVGKLEDVRVPVGRAPLDLLTEHREELTRHA